MTTDISVAIHPLGEWFVLTCFDTLVYYDHEHRELRHDDVATSPQNLTVVCSAKGISIRVAKLSTTAAAEAQSAEELREISIRNAGANRNVAFCHENWLATARPDGPITFDAQRLLTWEVFRLVRGDHLSSRRYWKPAAPQGGTQLMLAQLSNILGPDLERINLKINSFSPDAVDLRPLVVWLHNQPNPVYEWCNNPELVAKVSRFVFVSNWQQQKFMEAYKLPPERCEVIKNAITTNDTTRAWPTHDQWRWRCAYVSAPFRGLDVLLEAWNDLSPENAELHIWSGTDLWKFKGQEFRPLFSQAMESSNVHFHRIAPNSEIRAALLDMHFLLYPCTYDETFCISMVEAMAAGCRVIASSRAALPETAAGFARLYPFVEDMSQHKNVFMENLADELEHPWKGQTELAVAQQDYCRLAYDWTRRAQEWRHLIDELANNVEPNQPLIRATPTMKTLVFCTAFARTPDVWETRYRRWIQAIQASHLQFDQILIVDDGSSVLPEWDDVEIPPAESGIRSDNSILLSHFEDNLGRWRGHNYPGWYRSYAFAAEYARRHGFNRVVHIESDRFLIGDSVASLFNNVKDEWIALWDPFFEMPETAIQVAAGTGLESYYAFTRRPYSDLVGEVIERVLPFTRVIKSFTGGKYPEYLNYVPSSAEYVVQATEDYSVGYFWWLRVRGQVSLPDISASSEIIDEGLISQLAKDGNSQRIRIYTSHGTVAFVDENTWDLRHGPIEQSPANLWLVYDSDYGKLEYISGAVVRSVAFTATHSRVCADADTGSCEMAICLFRLVKVADERIGLKSGLRFLSAGSDGSILLSARECLGWEMFWLLHDPLDIDILADLMRRPLFDLSARVRMPSTQLCGESPGVMTGLEACFRADGGKGPHTGVPYIEFLELISAHIGPSSYLEIGTESGTSLKQFTCDAICVDPAFQITQDVLLSRRKTFFFQMTSDRFSC